VLFCFIANGLGGSGSGRNDKDTSCIIGHLLNFYSVCKNFVMIMVLSHRFVIWISSTVLQIANAGKQRGVFLVWLAGILILLGGLLITLCSMYDLINARMFCQLFLFCYIFLSWTFCAPHQGRIDDLFLAPPFPAWMGFSIFGAVHSAVTEQWILDVSNFDTLSYSFTTAVSNQFRLNYDSFFSSAPPSAINQQR